MEKQTKTKTHGNTLPPKERGARINGRWYASHQRIVQGSIERGEYKNISDAIRGIIEFFEENREKK